MNVELLDPLGARVTGEPLRDLDRGELRGLLADRGVVVFPDQPVEDEDFVAFLRGFGELMFATGETPVDACPDLNVISNVGRSTPPRSTFHVDTSYLRRPPAYTALRAVKIPVVGGETLFSNQYRAFETLPGALRERLRDRTITHVVTGLELGDDDEKAAEHPIFRTHPVSGRTALYLTTPARCAAVSGMDAAAAAAVVKALHAHSTAADNVYRHRWSPGDVVMWDNGCVLHRADHEGAVGDRVMHRGMVAAYDSSAVST